MFVPYPHRLACLAGAWLLLAATAVHAQLPPAHFKTTDTPPKLNWDDTPKQAPMPVGQVPHVIANQVPTQAPNQAPSPVPAEQNLLSTHTTAINALFERIGQLEARIQALETTKKSGGKP